MPPCRGNVDGEHIWRMEVVTNHGATWTYATYSTEDAAIDVYRIVEAFMKSGAVMIKFELGTDGLPNTPDQSDEAIDAREESDDTT